MAIQAAVDVASEAAFSLITAPLEEIFNTFQKTLDEQSKKIERTDTQLNRFETIDLKMLMLFQEILHHRRIHYHSMLWRI